MNFFQQHKAIVIQVAVLLALVFTLFFLNRLTFLGLSSNIDTENTELTQRKSSELISSLALVDKALAAKAPKNGYIVVNSAANVFSLYKNGELIKRDKCSTGSYIKLKKGDQQHWMFKTPKGEFRIRNKTVNPVWKKPDWAFVEAGLPVPSANHPSRFEYNVLGDYSLAIGDGYLIHGTLYQRFLGLPVTHGCIRLNDENLELVYKSLPIGAKVYIF
ncbi:MAG: L,D-transpeptidase ErfK/SrfK [Marinoscillum sp.]|jgi:L,D-transpeptidase ErfK/SrfK